MKWRLISPAILGMIALAAVCCDGRQGMQSTSMHGASAASVTRLRCEYRTDPLGIDVASPRLSWIIQSERRGEVQTAYQVLVASTSELLAHGTGDLWDTGKMITHRQNQIEYAGKPLTSERHCYWKVRIWDGDTQPSPWSESALWTMGLLDQSEWHAHWIGYNAAYQPTPDEAKDDALFSLRNARWIQMPPKKGKVGIDTFVRKQITLPTDRAVKRAMWSLYTFNEADAMINGQTIGHAAHWEKTAHLDATSALQPGANVLALTIHHTDPYLPAAIGKLIVQFTSGDNLVIPLDATWKASQHEGGPAQGWETIGFDTTGWTAALVLTNTPWGSPAVNDLPRWPAPYFRKEFSASRQLRRATLHVTALGTYELRLNGQRMSDDVLAPGWSEFHKRVYYQTYDVTRFITEGSNAIGVILGDGWYASNLGYQGKRNLYGGKPRLLLQLKLEFTDGTSQLVTTDNSWKATCGPIQQADILMGCVYDARLEMQGWDKPGFDDNAWHAANDAETAPDGSIADVTERLRTAVADGRLSFTVNNESLGGDPAPDIVKQLALEYRLDGADQKRGFDENQKIELGATAHPLTILHASYGPAASTSNLRVQADVANQPRVIEDLPVVSVTEPRSGRWTFDLGQNMVGWARLKVKGVAGQRITVRHGEMLNTDGTIYTANLRSCAATDEYILSGIGEEVLEPHFTYHGFRYVEVRGLQSKPALDALVGRVVHTPMQRAGQFACSNEMLNKLYSNIIWGQRGNYLAVPTDCPQRDERLGWTGDTQFFIPTAAYNFDVAPFFTRWLQTCEDDQRPDGVFPHVIPDVLGEAGGATGWTDAPLLCAYQIYRTYGDTRLLAQHFDAFDRYMHWLDTKTKNGISTVGGYGDWLNAGGGAKKEVIDTAYHAYLAGIMAEMAKAIGRDADAQRYAQQHDAVKAAFVKAFVRDDGSIEDSSQTGYALAFTMDLLPEQLHTKAAEKFVNEIERFKWHLATGFIGTPRLLPALSIAGRDDVAYRLLLTDTYPSWLFPVKNGATTMWERWNGWTPDKGFGDIGMNSYNHYAFGAVGEYLYSRLGGIRPADLAYNSITIHPVPSEALTFASASYDSMYGPISGSWKRQAGKLTLQVTVPPNTTATVFVPAASAAAVTEGGHLAVNAEDVKFLREENGDAVFAVGSGSYVFEAH